MADIETARILAEIIAKQGQAAPELIEPVPACPDCNGRGLIAIGRGVQYCLCPKGRELKAEWMAHPADLREMEERHSPTFPDPRPKTKAG